MKRKYLLVAGLVMMAVACQEPMQQEPEDRPVLDSPLKGAVDGKMMVLVSEEMRLQFEDATGEDGLVRLESVKSTETLPEEMEIISVKRVFTKDPRFVKRAHKAGLDRWYEITFNEDVPLTKAGSCISGIEGIEYAEYVYKPVSHAMEVYPFATSAPFDDPRAGAQWHYQNDGSRSNSIAGSDINLYDAYNRYGVYGSPNVVVSIVDGGIDVDHEDLAQNMWINEAEMNGQPGVDDDGNGFVDDIYGFNFVTQYMQGEIVAHGHGTHVAGTVAAVNNNGVGVIGIAGGNGSPDSGVRLMSCQIFAPNADNPYSDREWTGNSADAIRYGADNGAVISQNSWGYDPGVPTPYVIRTAIDYFIENAGMDDDGNQVGPMAGGIAIFAAGNDNVVEDSAPGNYTPTFSVAALNAQYERTRYSNIGTWVDVSAPGGEDITNNFVLSTYPMEDGGYANLQGTSMACPHVSGIAALVVSAKGGPGFTNKMLEEILLDACDPIIYEYNRFDLHGDLEEGMLLGRGLINTSWALASMSTVAPESPEFEMDSPNSNTLTINAVVPQDEDDGLATGLQVYYSTESFSSIDYDNIPGNITALDYKVRDLEDSEDGSSKVIVINGLDFTKTYYVAMSSSDRAGNKSELSAVETVTTGENHAPEITIPEEYADFIIKTYDSAEMPVAIADPDGHAVTASAAAGTRKLDCELVEDTLMVYINGWEFSSGDYTAEIKATDEYGMESTAAFKFSIRANSNPEVVVEPAEIPSVCFNGIGEEYRLDMAEYIVDTDGDPLTYGYTLSSEGIIDVVQTDNYLDITAMQYGAVTLTVSATDGVGDAAQFSMQFLIREGSNMVDIYPNPVYNDLHIRPGEEGNYEILISGPTGSVLFNDTVTVSPFNPLTVDMSKQAAGVYSVVIVSEDGTEYKTNVVKY